MRVKKDQRYRDKSISAKLSGAELKAVNEAIEHYQLGSLANLLQVACSALVEAHKRNDDLASPLRFLTAVQKYAVDRLREKEGI